MPVREDLFTHTINNLNVGKVQKDLSIKLNQLVQSCRETAQKGTLQITLTVIPDKAGQGQYVIRPKIKLDKPEFPTPETFMWGTPDGNLQTHHPDQGNLPLRVAGERKDELREASASDDKATA